MSNIVGYTGKSGKLRAYKKLNEVPDKFKEGNIRVHLSSLDGSINFWVDKSKLEDPPKIKNNGCDCDQDCCQPRCRCEYYCNCKGGNVYDC